MTIEYYPPSITNVLNCPPKIREKRLKNRGGVSTCQTCGQLSPEIATMIEAYDIALSHEQSNPDHIITVIEDCCKFGV